MNFKTLFEKKEIYVISFGFFSIISVFFLQRIYLLHKDKVIQFSYKIIDTESPYLLFWMLFSLLFFLFIQVHYKKEIKRLKKTIESRQDYIKQSEINSKEGRQKLVSLILPGYLEAFGEIGKQILLEKYINESVESCGKLGQIIEKIGASFSEQEVFMPNILKLIEQCFSYEITKNKITLTQEGEGFFTSGMQSQMYYLFYNIFKGILYRAPEGGKVVISFEEDESYQFIKIVDDGYLLPDELKKRHTKQNKDEIDRLCSLTNEETRNLCSYLGWGLFEERDVLAQNVTTIKIEKTLLKNGTIGNVYFLKNNPSFSTVMKNKER